MKNREREILKPRPEWLDKGARRCMTTPRANLYQCLCQFFYTPSAYWAATSNPIQKLSRDEPAELGAIITAVLCSSWRVPTHPAMTAASYGERKSFLNDCFAECRTVECCFLQIFPGKCHLFRSLRPRWRQRSLIGYTQQFTLDIGRGPHKTHYLALLGIANRINIAGYDKSKCCIAGYDQSGLFDCAF